MRTLQEKYNGVLEGNFSKTQFRRDAAMELPQFISSVNSFDDTVAILKNKGIVTEAKAQEPKYSTAKPADTIAPDILDTGIKFELDKKYGTLDVTPEQYEKCKEMAVKNLAKDVLYYVKQDSIQLDTPGEKMEKAKLREGKEEAWKDFQKKHNVTDKTIKVARKDFEREWEAGNIEEAIQNIESDEQTKKRIASLTNQLLQDVDPRDETVKAYAISVKNDLESRDASRMTQYKDILSLDDLKDDMEHYLTHDVDQLEENQIVDLPMTAAGYSRGETYDTEKYGKVKIIDQLDGDDIPAAYGRFRVEKINEDEEESPEDYANANAGSPMHAPPGLEEDLDATEKAASAKIGKGEEFTDDDAAAVADKMPKIKKDAEFKLIGEDEPDVEDLYQHDQEYLDTLKKRKALKEMFKKIIVNLINE